MSAKIDNWNPWHGCKKISDGCKHCYVYRIDKNHDNIQSAMKPHKTSNFDYPIKRKRDGSYKLASGSLVFTCFSSDFLLADADDWRIDAWKMIKERSDCLFYFFTKRIDRLSNCLPPDWNDGYDNVIIGCTVENQDRADYRLPIFNSLPIKHKAIIVAPMLEKMNISKYLNDSIEEVSLSGESGDDVRELNYDWVLEIRKECIEKDIPFIFHQTGSRFIKDGKTYNIKRKDQITQANKANIDYKFKDREIVNDFDEIALL